MNNIGVIAFTRRGCALAREIARALALVPDYEQAAFSVFGPARLADEAGVEPYGDLESWTAMHFAQDDALVFVSATGIAVRAIAPHVRDKFTDPAVVCIDEAGLFAVSLLSGHVGGANDLARAIADAVGGQAAVSTATDVNRLFAVDEWAARNNLTIVERVIAKEISAALLEGRPVGVRSDFAIGGKIPQGITEGVADIGFCVSLSQEPSPFARTLHLVPRAITVGVGCRRGTDFKVLENAVHSALSEAGASPRAVAALASIDVKSDEEAIGELAASEGWDAKFYSAEQLAAVPGDFASSAFVERTVGVDNVCERAACADGGTLMLGKRSGDGVTVAIAFKEPELAFGPARDRT